MELNLQERKNDKGEAMFYLDTAELEKAIKEGTAGSIKEQIKSALDVEKTQIFDGSDGRIYEKGQSVIDSSFFSKRYQMGSGGSGGQGQQVSGKAMGRMLATAGGPFLNLSPVMEKFAEACKQRFSAVNVKDWNKEILEWNQKDTMSGLSITDAGALVPIEFLATVIEFATAQSRILPQLWRIPMASASMRIPQLSQTAGSYYGGIVLYHPDELTSKTITEPTLTYKEFTAKKLIGLCPMSDELIADSAINIINYLTGLFVRAFQYKIEGEVISGTGANGQLTGILTDSSINHVPRTTVLQVKYDDILNMESALDENFQNLTWLSRRATINYLRKQKDTVGQPVYRDTAWSPIGPTPMGGNILDYPVIKTRNVPALGTQGDIILGDLGFYIWAVRADMVIDLSRERYFEYDATALRFVMRMDGKPGVPIAFVDLDNVPES